MSTTGVSNSVTIKEAATRAETTSKSSSSLTSDAFMSLLLTQMKNQNPMEPMNDTEMISQMSQLSSLQELQKVSSSMTSMEYLSQMLSASDMIGKTVTYKNSDGETVSGAVSSISLEDSEVYVTVGEETVAMDSLLTVA